MKFTVEEMLQDSRWEIFAVCDSLQEAVKSLRRLMKAPLSRMGRIVELGGVGVLITLPGCGWTKEAKVKVCTLVSSSEGGI